MPDRDDPTRQHHLVWNLFDETKSKKDTAPENAYLSVSRFEDDNFRSQENKLVNMYLIVKSYDHILNDLRIPAEELKGNTGSEVLNHSVWQAFFSNNSPVFPKLENKEVVIYLNDRKIWANVLIDFVLSIKRPCGSELMMRRENGIWNLGYGNRQEWVPFWVYDPQTKEYEWTIGFGVGFKGPVPKVSKLESEWQWWKGSDGKYWPLGEHERHKLAEGSSNGKFELGAGSDLSNGIYLMVENLSGEKTKLKFRYHTTLLDKEGQLESIVRDPGRIHKLTHIIWSDIFERDEVYFPDVPPDEFGFSFEKNIFGEPFSMGMSIEMNSFWFDRPGEMARGMDRHNIWKKFAEQINESIKGARVRFAMFQRDDFIWTLGCQIHAKHNAFNKRWINFWEYNDNKYSWSKRLPEALQKLGVKEEEEVEKLMKQARELNDKILWPEAEKQDATKTNLDTTAEKDQAEDADSVKEFQLTSLTKEERIHAIPSSSSNPSVVGKQQQKQEQPRVRNFVQSAEKNANDDTMSNVLGNHSGNGNELPQSSREIIISSSESSASAPKTTSNSEGLGAQPIIRNATNKHLGNHGFGSNPGNQERKSEVKVQANVVKDWNRDDEKIRQNSPQPIKSVVQDQNTKLTALPPQSEQKLSPQNVVIQPNPGNSRNQPANRTNQTPPQAQAETTSQKIGDGHVGATSSNVQSASVGAPRKAGRTGLSSTNPIQSGTGPSGQQPKNTSQNFQNSQRNGMGRVVGEFTHSRATSNVQSGSVGPPSRPNKSGRAGPNSGTPSRSGTEPSPQLSNHESPPSSPKKQQQTTLKEADPSDDDNGKKIKLSTEQERELDKIQTSMESRKKTEINAKTGSSPPKTSLRGGNPAPPVTAGSTESKASVCARIERFVDSCSRVQQVCCSFVMIVNLCAFIYCCYSCCTKVATKRRERRAQRNEDENANTNANESDSEEEKPNSSCWVCCCCGSDEEEEEEEEEAPAPPTTSSSTTSSDEELKRRAARLQQAEVQRQREAAQTEAQTEPQEEEESEVEIA